MLIATLPAVYQTGLVERIVNNPAVNEVRYNVGVNSPLTPKETLKQIIEITREAGIRLWVDLKGRQLRITRWANPEYGKIFLNHKVRVSGEAEVYFRGDDHSRLKAVKGNCIFVDPPPRFSVGDGQAINIIGEEVEISGYLTRKDIQFIKAACELGVFDFMLSFVEKQSDIDDVRAILRESPNYHNQDELVLKIESQAGLDFIESFSGWEELHSDRLRLMAARDDLMINIGPNKAMMIKALKRIVEIDSSAIAASRIFMGVEDSGAPTMADFSDLHLLHAMGYQNFLLSDGICRRNFSEAIQAWRDYEDFASGRASFNCKGE
jgi:pyruvate kinase